MQNKHIKFWAKRSKPFVVNIEKFQSNAKVKRRFFESLDEAELFVAQLVANQKALSNPTINDTIEMYEEKIGNEKNPILTRNRFKEILSHNKQLANYKFVERNIVFGKVKIKSLTLNIIQDYINELREKNISYDTRRHRLLALKDLLSFAQHQSLISFNILVKSKIINKKTQIEKEKDQLQNYNPAKIESVINNSGYYKIHVKFAAETGLRNSEQRALMWGDFDLANGSVDINKSFVRLSDGQNIYATKQVYNGNEILTEGTKSGKHAKRKVYLQPALLQKLIKWREKQNLLAIHTLHRQLKDTDFIFPKQENLLMPTRRETWGKRGLSKSCESLKLDHLRWHDLRHWFATYNIGYRQMPIKDVSLLLGHKETSLIGIRR